MGRPRKLAGLAELCRRRGRSAPAAAGEQQQQRQGCGIVIRPASRPSRRHVRVVKVQCTVASQAQARGGLHSKKESLFAPHSGSRWTPPGRWMQTPQSTGSCWRRPAVDGRGGSQRGGRHSPHSVMPSSGSWRLASAWRRQQAPTAPCSAHLLLDRHHGAPGRAELPDLLDRQVKGQVAEVDDLRSAASREHFRC